MPIEKQQARLLIFLLPVLLVCSVMAKAQDLYMYEFSKNAELLKGAPISVKPGQKFNVKIPFDTVLFKGQVDSLLVNILQARIYWSSLLGRLKGQTEQSVAWRTEITKMLHQLENLSKILAGQTTDQLLARNCDKPDELKNLFFYTPGPYDIVCWLKQQITLKIKTPTGSDCIIRPKLKYGDCVWYYTFDSSMTVNSDLNLYVYKEDAFRSMIIDWYVSHIDNFPYFEFALFESAVQGQAELFTKIKKYSSTNLYKEDAPDDSCKELNKMMKHLIDTLPTTDFAAAYKPLNNRMKDLMTWLLSTVWIGKGTQVQLNPLGFTNGGLYRDQGKKASKDATDSVVMQKLEKILTDSTLKITQDNYKDILSVWYKRDSAKTRQDTTQMAVAKKQEATGAQSIQGNAQALAGFEQTSVLLNIIRTPLAVTKHQKMYLRNYYYNRRPEKRDFRYDYPEDDLVVLAIHNMPANRGISIADQKSSYTEQPGITEQVGQTLPASALSSSAAWNGQKVPADNLEIISAQMAGREQLIASLDDNPPLPSGQDAIHKTCKTLYDTLYKQLFRDFRLYKVWDSLYNLTQVPPQILERIPNDSPRMYTDVIYPDGSQKPPYQYLYKLSARDTSKSLSLLSPLDSSGYRVGRRRTVELALGVAYAVTSARVINVARDSSNGNLLPSSTETKAQFVVGLKFHLWKKIYWENDKFVFSCKSLSDGTWKERLSLFVGTSIPSPLNNIYTGVGIDLIPGLNINAGGQWFQYNKFSVNNNQIINQTAVYRPAFYLAITADPTLVVNIVKTFFN